VDPTNDAFVVLLTNAVHPKYQGKPIKGLRGAVGTAVANALLPAEAPPRRPSPASSASPKQMMTSPVTPILAEFGPSSWVVVGCYFALMIFVGFYIGRRRPTGGAEAYFLGNRSLPSWALAISIVATMLSAATFVGVPDEVYLGDTGYLILNVGGFIAVFVVATLFVPTLYRAGTVTIYGYLGQRFGETGMMAVSCTFLFGRMLASGTRLFFAAIPLCLLLFGTSRPSPGQLVLAICLIGVIGTFYTVAGGIRAVVWTDTIQLALVVGAALLTIGMLLHRIPLSIPEIVNVLGQPGTGVGDGSKLRLVDTSFDFSKPYTLWAAMFGVVFLNTATYGVDHDFAQRFLVSKSVVRGAASVVASQFIGMLVVMLFMAIGLLLWIFYKRPDVMGAMAPSYVPSGGVEPVYPQFLLRELPPIASGLALAGFFAIAQGSMDSAINAMASSAGRRPVLPDAAPARPARRRRRRQSRAEDRRHRDGRGHDAVRDRLCDGLQPEGADAAAFRAGYHGVRVRGDARRVPDGAADPPRQLGHGDRCPRRRGRDDHDAPARHPQVVDGAAVRHRLRARLAVVDADRDGRQLPGVLRGATGPG
jgi:Na+/proline symporter